MKQLVKNKPSGSQKLFADALNKCLSQISSTLTVLLKTIFLIQTIITLTAMVGIAIAIPDTSMSVAKTILRLVIPPERTLNTRNKGQDSTNRFHSF